MNVYSLYGLIKQVFFFLMIATDILYLLLAQMPKCPDLTTFVLIDDDDDRQTQPIILPLAHEHRVITVYSFQFSVKDHHV